VISIVGIELAVPPDRAELAEIIATLDPADCEQACQLGIAGVHVANGLSAHELTSRAARAALARAGLTADDVDVMVHVPGRVPEAFMQSELTRLQAEIGARHALALSVGELGCASSSSALAVLDALLNSDPAHVVALLTMAALTPTPYRYRRPVTLNGDGGMAVIVKANGTGFALRDMIQVTNGKYWNLFSVEYLNEPPGSWREKCRDEKQYAYALGMESIGVTRKLVDDLLSRNGAAIEDLGHVVMQNLSRSSFEFYEQVLGRPISPVCATNLASYGHLGPLDVFLNLHSLDQLCSPGTFVLVVNNSPVAAWTALLFEKVS